MFAALSCLLVDVNFTNYDKSVKFMHFGALQYFSFINLNQYQPFYFFTQMYMTG